MMQFQLRIFSTLAVVIAATQSLPKEHVALVQHHASKTTGPSPSDTELLSKENVTLSCPGTYEQNSHDLINSRPNVWKEGGNIGTAACAAKCDAREGCTGFETGVTWPGINPGCWTYTGGNADLGWGVQWAGYITCLAKCPGGFAPTPKDLNGASLEASGVSDAMGCAKKCKARDGCTSFEYGKYQGKMTCWTYTGGDEDVQANNQWWGYNSCVVVFGRWQVTRKGGSKGKTKVDVFCGKNTDTFSIGAKKSKYCEKNVGGDSQGQVIVNQDGEDRSKAWFCTGQGETSIVGTPTFTAEDACSNEHAVIDEGK